MELKEITIDNINMSPAYIFHIKSLDYIYIGRITGISNNKITIKTGNISTHNIDDVTIYSIIDRREHPYTMEDIKAEIKTIITCFSSYDTIAAGLNKILNSNNKYSDTILKIIQ